jgi:hypothetical protein
VIRNALREMKSFDFGLPALGRHAVAAHSGLPCPKRYLKAIKITRPAFAEKSAA